MVITSCAKSNARYCFVLVDKTCKKKFTQMYLLYTDYLQLYTSRDSDNPMEQSPINTFPPSLGTLKQIPALTAGLPIFTFILCFLKNTLGFKFSSLILYPTSPLEFNLNALSLYSLIHVGYLHWLLNICAILPRWPCMKNVMVLYILESH